MKKVLVYQCLGDHLEKNHLRALAWDLNYCSKNAESEITLPGALWILNNEEFILQLFSELKAEATSKHV